MIPLKRDGRTLYFFNETMGTSELPAMASSSLETTEEEQQEHMQSVESAKGQRNRRIGRYSNRGKRIRRTQQHSDEEEEEDDEDEPDTKLEKKMIRKRGSAGVLRALRQETTIDKTTTTSSSSKKINVPELRKLFPNKQIDSLATLSSLITNVNGPLSREEKELEINKASARKFEPTPLQLEVIRQFIIYKYRESKTRAKLVKLTKKITGRFGDEIYIDPLIEKTQDGGCKRWKLSIPEVSGVCLLYYSEHPRFQIYVGGSYIRTNIPAYHYYCLFEDGLHIKNLILEMFTLPL